MKLKYWWNIRWWIDRRWRTATRSRVLREKKEAESAGKPFKMTALRRFVLAREKPVPINEQGKEKP